MTNPEITPEASYYVPILQLLVNHGGVARAGDVIEDIPSLMGPLTEKDRELLKVREIRWRNRAKWARSTLVKMGCISSASPSGIWEITDDGRRWLQAHSSDER